MTDKKETCPYCTSFLFPKTNYLIGAGSIFNIAGNYFDFNYSKSEREADLRALQCDWEMVGSDFNQAISSLLKNSNSPEIHEHTPWKK